MCERKEYTPEEKTSIMNIVDEISQINKELISIPELIKKLDGQINALKGIKTTTLKPQQISSHIVELESLVKNISFYWIHDSRIYSGDLDGIQKIIDNLRQVAEEDSRWLDK